MAKTDVNLNKKYFLEDLSHQEKFLKEEKYFLLYNQGIKIYFLIYPKLKPNAPL